MVGCRFWKWLSTFTDQEFGFEVFGVHLREDSVALMRRLGFQAYCQLVETVKFEKEISVLSMMDVLKHIPHPRAVLTSLYGKMEQNGCLLISMPNSENIVWKLMTEQIKIRIQAK